MSVYGIISEFNPFHNGHKYIIDSAKKAGAERVVCIMSGNAVQRGETAIVDKYKRAEMAVRSGADLVVELPFPWCASGAESFARCGVYIADALCDTLYFGSECGDISALKNAAEIAASAEFKEEYKSSLVENTGAAQVYFELLSKRCGRDFFSNDILGIEYIKAAGELESALSLVTLKRRGAAYLSCDIEKNELPSATAIRALARKEGARKVVEYLPRTCADILECAERDGEISDMARLSSAIKLYFRLRTPSELMNIADIDAGIASRICSSARECDGELLSSLATKRYTDARLKRAILFALCGVTTEDLRARPVYVNLLAANSAGRELLASVRKECGIRILGKAADIPDIPEAKRAAELSERLDSLFTLSLSTEGMAADMIKKKPFIME